MSSLSLIKSKSSFLEVFGGVNDWGALGDGKLQIDLKLKL